MTKPRPVRLDVKVTFDEEQLERILAAIDKVAEAFTHV